MIAVGVERGAVAAERLLCPYISKCLLSDFFRCLQSDVFCVPSPVFLTAPHPVPRGVQLSQPHTFRGRMTAHYLSCTRAFFLCPRVYTPRSLPRMWVQALCGSLRESASPRTAAHGLDGGNPWRDNILSYLRWAILIHILYSPYKLLSGIQPRCPQ